jgi:hypothetical protein
MKTPEDSYRASSHIALRGEAHTVAEPLIKPCAGEMETCDLGEELKKKLKAVQLSNNTVKHHIQDFSAEIEKQLVSQLIPSFACFVET